MSNGEPVRTAVVRPPGATPRRAADRRDLLFRGVILAAVLGSVSLIWWSFGLVLSPRLEQSRQLAMRVSRLSSEVDDLDRQWPKAAVEQLSNQVHRAEATLFRTRLDVEAWLDKAKALAAVLALDLRAELGPPSRRTAGGRTLAVIPVTVSVEVQRVRPELGPASPYQRILSLSRSLTDEDKQRADLMEVSVAGGVDSVTRAVLVLNYWAAREGPP